MAEIRSYLREREKREQNQTDYRTKIRRHRFGSFLRIAAIVLAVAVIAAVLITRLRDHVYTEYTVVNTVEWKNVPGTTDVRLGETVMTYSRDGAHCTDAKGELLWNQTYEIQELLLDVCGDVAVISAYNGRDVYVVSAEKVLGYFSTNLPIRSVAVSQNGYVAVVMADTGVTHYNIYSATGKILFEGQATMSGSGYPMAVGFSPNGELLQISYIYLDAGIQKTKVAFYNLGPVGDNVTDQLVGVYEYQDVVIPYVRFMNNQTAFAVGDHALMIYRGAQKPVPEAQITYDDEVRSVYYSQDYVGLVFYSQQSGSLYRMQVYDVHGKQMGTYYFDMDYTEIIFDGDTIIVYNDAECSVTTMKQEEKYHGAFDKAVKCLVPLKGSYRYLVVTNDSLDIIQLK